MPWCGMPAAIPSTASATWPNCCPAVARACWRGLAPAARVYSCDRPLSSLAGLRPSLELAQWQDRKGQGVIRVPDPNGGGQPVIVGEYQTTWTRDTVSSTQRVIRGDSSSPATGSCGTSLAVSWLTFVHIPQTQGVAAGSGGGAHRGGYPQPAGRSAARRARRVDLAGGTTQQGQTSGFERFAARSTGGGGGRADVRAIAAEHNVTLVPSGLHIAVLAAVRRRRVPGAAGHAARR